MENLIHFILTIVQRDAIQSSLFIILQVHSTCFGCQLQPSSGVHKTVTTASGTYIFYAATTLQRGQTSLYKFRVSTTPIIRSTQNCNYSLPVLIIFFMQLPPSNVAKLYCTGFVFQSHPSSGVHKTVTKACGTVRLPTSNVARLDHVRGR
jgi:hypothetical protein